MTALCELARLIRSKNAGPFWLTFDILFDSAEAYSRVKTSGVLTRELFAERLNVRADTLRLFFCDHALAIKASIPRPVAQGDIGDGDGHGGQQYAPLVDVDIPD